MSPAKPIDALSLLTQQHDEVDAWIAKIEKARDRDSKARLFAELADKLAAHARIEETLFYPTVMGRQTHDMLLESAEEHLQIKRVLADLLELDCDDPQFDAKLSVMKEDLQHHAHDEEEAHLFPKVRQLLSTEELQALGAELLSRFEALITETPRHHVASETAQAVRL